ncbi:MAG: DUF3021 domain-containing protein [Streptococcaceae bacterium]|nr:DUF3021 domain-containing protein [Streptococcaceae bacterium]
MKYLKAMGFGVIIASLCLAVETAIFWNTYIVLVILIQGALQGLAAYIIYRKLRVPYTVKIIIHSITSYILALLMVILVNQNVHSSQNISQWMISFTISWFAVYIMVHIYFYFKNKREAEEITQKLEEKYRENQ